MVTVRSKGMIKSVTNCNCCDFSVQSCYKMQKVVYHKRNVLCYNTDDEVCKTAGQ